MANWRYTLPLKEIFEDFRADKISVAETGEKVAIAIETLIMSVTDEEDDLDEYTLEQIIDSFHYGLDETSTVDDFDGIMEELYDWADMAVEPFGYPRTCLCWVETF